MENKMSFESFLISNYGGLSHVRSSYSSKVGPAKLLAEYFGECVDKYYWRYVCLIGYICEDASDQFLCTIDNETKAMPKDVGEMFASQSNYLKHTYSYKENLWRKMNEGVNSGVFFPLVLTSNAICFLYSDFARKYLMDGKELISYDKLNSNYPVLLATVEQEVIRALNPSCGEKPSPMSGTVEIIDRVLQRGDYPSIQLIHSLAHLKYENQNNEGVICFTSENNKSRLNFLKPQPLVYNELRALRKYFQMAGDKLHLIAERYKPVYARYDCDPNVDVWMIKGIGECSDSQGKLYFSGGNKWRFVWSEEELGYDGAHFYARKQFAKEQELLNDLKFLCTDSEVEQFVKIVERLTKQKHGTMLVISSNAKGEAVRLGLLRRAIEIDDYKLYELSDQEMIMVSSIDGCILASPQGNCTALGVILDGEANIATDIGRGARYNSALTYIKKMKDTNVKAAAVVISEDGTVDFITTDTIHEKESYSDEIARTEMNAYYDIQDARFEQRFAMVEDEMEDY